MKTAFPETGWSCRDEASGLFHQAHFLAALEGELARWDRWVRPLALALVELEPAPDWAAFGHLAQSALRSVDLAARLSDNLAGFLFPEAGRAWAGRRLAEFLAELRRDARLGRSDIRTGLTLALPRADLSAGEMMALALRDLSGGPDRAARAPEADPVTFIIEDELRLLFEGFRALEDGRRP
ncbi:MAG: hypothetical protein LBV70_07210 [Candidatus Adiutrix sp.]|nr:hypothetical protein [Candidatus Adiutrix sp.]